MFGRRKRLITRLLIAEDEPLVAFDNEHHLADEGYRIVATVDRVADALSVIGDGAEIDLVLADISLADGSGIDIARAAHARGIAVVFVTGDCSAEGRPFAMGCLAKPYSPRDLVAAIAAVDGAMQGAARPRRLPAGFTLFDDAG
ncbi:response regulator [uncultured Sphingomonas sp.]|uniref:response regulator n=1 Tax=uncultured Sphingomonas sp. TaxID=158754 RepID=UPI0035CAF2E4